MGNARRVQMQGELVFRATVRKRKECGIIGSKVGWRSTFKVYLPVASRPAEDTSLEEAEVMGGTETVLVVDDEELVDLRAVLRKVREVPES
jgi:hypothetical protein